MFTFPKYQKQKNWKKNQIQIFYPTPLGGGYSKMNIIFWKLVVEPKLQNMIFGAHKKRNKSKRWLLYLNIWASYSNFCWLRYKKNVALDSVNKLSEVQTSWKLMMKILAMEHSNFRINAFSYYAPGAYKTTERQNSKLEESKNH